MRRITRFVLSHRLLVAGLWLLVVTAGVVTLGSTTKRLSANFALPGQPGYVTDTKIGALYHNGGSQQPTVEIGRAHV